jgi:hypothetical protein
MRGGPLIFRLLSMAAGRSPRCSYQPIAWKRTPDAPSGG